MKNQWRFAACLALAALFSVSGDATAQTASAARLSGSVSDAQQIPVGGALITLSAPGSSAVAYQATASSSGTFALRSVQPGAYEIRVEALGYRPLVVQGLVLSGGEDRSLSLTLTVDPPPVELVDTITVAASTASRFRVTGLQLGPSDIAPLPHRFDDLAGVVSSASAFDHALGSQGLPGEMTALIADGVPFYRAEHPTSRVEKLPDALFNRRFLDGVALSGSAADAALSGTAGGVVSLTTRRGVGRDVSVGGSYSGDPLWSSSEQTFTAPTLLSWQGFGTASTEAGPGANFLVAGDALQHESPLTPRIGETAAASLAGLAPDELSRLTEPGIESVRRYSGLARYDRQISSTDRFFIRGLVGASERMFVGAGPQDASATPDESVDFSTAFGYTSQTSRTTTIDLRGGVSGSYRDFGFGGNAPSTLASPYSILGSQHAVSGASSRTDVVLLPSARFETEAGLVTAGINLRSTSHSMERRLHGFAFSNGADLLANVGFGREAAAPSVDFSTREVGFHLQLDRPVSPQLALKVGVRYDREIIGGDGGPLNEAWVAASGLINNEFVSGFNQFGARGALVWTPTPSGATRVLITGSLDHGDVSPRWIYQLNAESTDATDGREIGSGVEWPTGSLPAASSATSMTMFGPEARAPVSVEAGLTLVQSLGTATVASVAASSRRTDFFMRRRNFNLPVVPVGQDAGGRAVYGPLTQAGALVGVAAGQGGRFTDFGTVNALDPDGWSEYRGVTASLEHQTAALTLFGSYTWSETTDNWIGAGQGVEDAAMPRGIPTADTDPSWDEGVSDFDITHRASVGAEARIGAASLGVLYRFASGTPFTPGYQFGVDANGDGSAMNDPALTIDAAALSALDALGTCSTSSASYAVRNSCRTPSSQELNVRLSFDLTNVGARRTHLMVDVLNVLESKGGVVDTALHLVDPAGSITTDPDGTVNIPTTVNPNFGDVVYPASRGRAIRIGLRIGG
ncbi:MAG: carboxypeptidase-like regulatory domain-containing protein [Gemmatimonadota bacterium]